MLAGGDNARNIPARPLFRYQPLFLGPAQPLDGRIGLRRGRFPPQHLVGEMRKEGTGEAAACFDLLPRRTPLPLKDRLSRVRHRHMNVY